MIGDAARGITLRAFRGARARAPGLTALAERLSWTIARRPATRRLARIETPSGAITIAHVGRDALFGPWLGSALGATCEAPSGRVRVTANLAHAPGEADIEAVEVPRWIAPEFARAGFLLVPLVAHVQPLVGEDGRPTKHETDTLRRLDASALRVRIGRDAGDLERFHDELYRPMVESRHGDAGRPTPIGVLRAGLRSGWLVLVDSEGTPVSGALVVPSATDSRSLQIWVVGVRGGDYDAVPDLARQAPVAFSVRFAREHGFRSCDHRLSLPLLTDGLTRRKLRWGTHVVADPEHRDVLAVRFTRDSSALSALLEATPFVALGPDGLVGIRTGARVDPWPPGLGEASVDPTARALETFARSAADGD